MTRWVWTSLDLIAWLLVAGGIAALFSNHALLTSAGAMVAAWGAGWLNGRAQWQPAVKRAAWALDWLLWQPRP